MEDVSEQVEQGAEQYVEPEEVIEAVDGFLRLELKVNSYPCSNGLYVVFVP
jgi:hypothetical protein